MLIEKGALPSPPNAALQHRVIFIPCTLAHSSDQVARCSRAQAIKKQRKDTLSSDAGKSANQHPEKLPIITVLMRPCGAAHRAIGIRTFARPLSLAQVQA